MDKEKELLLSNSKEWLVDQIIREREQYHKKMTQNITFHNWLIEEVRSLTDIVENFHKFGVLPKGAQDGYE